jgi:RimJ/RimL family protein N-acetyltransferase
VEIRHGRVVLRDLIPEDVEDHVRWFTEDRAWLAWDSPWDSVGDDPERVRRVFLEKLRQGPRGPVRWTLEIALVDGPHVGQVNRYELGELGRAPAVGVGVRAEGWRGRGIGTEAFPLWLAYVFHALDAPVVYAESWSGNERVVRLVSGLGFREIRRLPEERPLRGKRYDALRWALEREAFEAARPGLIEEISRQLPAPPPPPAATAGA